MSKLFILSLFLLCALASSQDFLPPQPLGMDLQKCFGDVMSLKSEIQGFLSKGDINMQSMLAEFAKLSPIFASLKKDCLFGLGASNTLGANLIQCFEDVEGLAPLVSQLVKDVSKADLSACLQDLNRLSAQVGPIMKDCL